MASSLRRVFLLFIVAGASPAFGQEILSCGVKAGITAAELYSFASAEARWGLTRSLFVTMPLTGGFESLLEGGYHAKGYHEESEFVLEDDGARYGGYDTRFNYGFVLLAPQYAGALGTSGLHLFAFAGPRVDIFISESFSLLESQVDPDYPIGTRRFSSPDYNRFVFGATAGFGIDFSHLMAVPLLAELRYNGDITPTYSFSGGEFRVRNRTFDLRLGLSF